MAFEIPPFPSDPCTRCGNPIGPRAWTVPTVDGQRHEFCAAMAPAEPFPEVSELGEVVA